MFGDLLKKYSKDLNGDYKVVFNISPEYLHGDLYKHNKLLIELRGVTEMELIDKLNKHIKKIEKD